jgi:hypothetical protein
VNREEALAKAGLLDENGELRRIIGTLPVTADGCVAGFEATLWTRYYGGPATSFRTPAPYTSPTPWEELIPIHRLYSTREAAERAAKEQRIDQ